jgi:MFS family permease
VTVYAFASGFTSILTSVGYAPPEAGVIVAVGAFGFLACALFAVFFAERLERKLWLPIGAVLTVLGGVIVAAGGDQLGVAFVGAGVIFFGFNIWVPMTYARSAENFPTRARTTGFALVDGVGHLGGGIGVLVIAPIIPDMSVFGALMLVSAFLVVAAVIGQLGIDTRNRRFEELAP